MAMKHVKDQTIIEEINELLSDVPTEIIERVKGCFERLHANKHFQIRNNDEEPSSSTSNQPPSVASFGQQSIPTVVNTSGGPSIVNSTTITVSSSTAVAKRPRGGSNDLPARKRIKNLKSTDEVLRALLAIREENPKPSTDFTNGARGFYSSQMKPVLNCLEKHCNHSFDQFKQKWGDDLKISHFAKNKCKGDDNGGYN